MHICQIADAAAFQKCECFMCHDVVYHGEGNDSNVVYALSASAVAMSTATLCNEALSLSHAGMASKATVCS